MHRSENFRTVLSERQNANPLDTKPQKQISTQNDNSRSFKVIHFDVNEEPLRGYVDLGREGSEDIASERSE